jgi:hypothetical protein
MVLNGSWRIAIVIIALILSTTVWSALTDDKKVGTALVVYDPPAKENVSGDAPGNPYVPYAKCDAYNEKYAAKIRAIAQ